jgi:transcriptional regulator with XRE-family HTH domain
MSKIKEARIAASLTAAEVAASVGRSAEWMSRVEGGITQLSLEHERLVLTAIARLASFAETIRSMRATLTCDLRLPPVKPGDARSRRANPARTAEHA